MNERKRQEKIERLKAQADVDQNVRDRVFKTAMGKGLHKFLAVSQTHTSDPLKTKADLYRKMLQYRVLLDEKIDEFETALTASGVEIYFPKDEEYVVTEKNKDTGDTETVVKKMTTKSHWNKAMKGFRKGD